MKKEALMGGAGAAIVLLGLCYAAWNTRTRPAPVPPLPLLTSDRPSVLSTQDTSPRLPVSPEGKKLWQRLRTESGPQGTPIISDVTVTDFTQNGAVQRQVFLTMQEGTQGRYRLTYSAPASVRGRVVVCDGKMLYQYEPARQVLLKRSVQSEKESAEDAALEDVVRPADGLLPVAGEEGTFLGRPAQTLFLQDKEGHIRRRCFVDSATGRSLLTEVYAAPNKSDTTGKERLLHRVEKTHFALAPHSNDTVFVPHFPKTARVLIASRVPSFKAASSKVAAGIGLPVRAEGYRLRTVLRPTEKKSSPSQHEAQHAVYSNGAHTVSVFVTTLSALALPALPAPALSVPEGKGWRSVALNDRAGDKSSMNVPEAHKPVSGFAKEDEGGRSGVVWLKAGHRYVLTARLSLDEALKVARALVQE